MKIRASTLANRFYKTDGWTKDLVYSLLHTVGRYTPPRPEDQDIIVEDRGDYYAIYVAYAIFDPNKIAQHEYEPYSPSDCDQHFHQKNKVHGVK